MRLVTTMPACIGLLDCTASNVSCSTTHGSSPHPPSQGPRVSDRSSPHPDASLSAPAPPRPPVLPDDLAQQAAEWLVRRGDVGWASADEQDWLRWLRASPEHRAAYAQAERLWAELAGLKQAPELLAPEALMGAGADGQMDAVRTTVADGLPGRRARSRSAALPAWLAARSARAWGAASLATIALVAVLAGTGGDPLLALQADHRSAVGGAQDLALPDGSRVRLGADSAVAIHFSEDERRVDLLQGEALFEAAPVRRDLAQGERRPFVVAAAQGRTRALGTRFIVERLATHTRVTGVEHQVAVALDAAPQRAAVLSPGQVARYDDQGVTAVDAPAIDAVSARERGLLVFERAELADVVARLNRYHAGRIAIHGEALAQRRVSGVFPARDIDGALQSIADELGAKALRLPGLVLLY